MQTESLLTTATSSAPLIVMNLLVTTAHDSADIKMMNSLRSCMILNVLHFLLVEKDNAKLMDT
jgi:hypothetical protein